MSNNVKRTRRRRRRGAAIGLIFFVLAAISAALVLCVIMFCKIEEVSISGCGRYSDNEIRSAAGIMLQENIFTLSTGQVEEKLAAQFPYIKEVKVSRRLPNTVSIEISEETPRFAAIYATEKYTELSDEGRVLRQAGGASDAALLPLYGADFSGYAEGSALEGEDLKSVRAASDIADAIAAADFQKVSYLDISDRLCLYMLYDGRILVKLGTQLDIERKLSVISEVAENQLAGDFEGTLDVTIDGKAYSLECDIADMLNEVYLLQSIIHY